MPEGDTIFRAARNLERVLAGQVLLEVRVRRASLTTSSLPVLDHSSDDGTHVAADRGSSTKGLPEFVTARIYAGKRVVQIEPRGKHLLIHCDNAPTIHSHLGMTGSWHCQSRGAGDPAAAHRAAIMLRTADVTCWCQFPKTLELLRPADLRHHVHLTALGPDLLDDAFDGDEATRRCRLHDHQPIGEVLMDQRAVCGIGNIYKSELLFLERWDPFQPVASWDDAQFAAFWQRARRLMRRNGHQVRRQTRYGRDGGSHWVYGRSGRPCFECGAVVRMQRQGLLGRSTYWCERCQTVGRSSS